MRASSECSRVCARSIEEAQCRSCHRVGQGHSACEPPTHADGCAPPGAMLRVHDASGRAHMGCASTTLASAPCAVHALSRSVGDSTSRLDVWGPLHLISRGSARAIPSGRRRGSSKSEGSKTPPMSCKIQEVDVRCMQHPHRRYRTLDACAARSMVLDISLSVSHQHQLRGSLDL